MNFKFENLGPIKEGNIKIKDLTIICGENNTGKTYISYALYGFYKLFDSYFKKEIIANEYIDVRENCYYINLEKLYGNIERIRIDALNKYKQHIYRVFNVNKEVFKSLKLDVDFLNNYKNKDEFFDDYEINIKEVAEILEENIIVSREDKMLKITNLSENEEQEILKSETFLSAIIRIAFPSKLRVLNNDVFMLPAERSGINIFFKELNVNRNNEIFALNERIKMKTFMNKISKYSLPISDYINFLNNMENKLSIKENFIDSFGYLEDDVICGKYSIDSDNNIKFLHRDFNKNESIDFHIASSTAKTLFSLDYYLKYNATAGDILIIDEPELNLHPDNQRRLTRLMAQIVNKGIKLIISTHSDYIIKELNNLIILGRKFNGYENLMKKYNYKENELLQEEKIGAYVFNNKTILETKIEEEGIIISTFDDVINSYNESSDDIYYAYEDCLEYE